MIKKYTDFDLTARNTFRMKVRCALYVEVTEETDLPALDWSLLPQPVLVLGGGSNLLFTADYPGTVLHLAIRTAPQLHEEKLAEVLVTVGAGVVFDDFCAWAAGEGLWGPENLSLIPGECGASAVQNIGAYGVEVKDILADIRAWDRLESRFVHIPPASCAYGYRRSNFKSVWKGRYIITAVTYRLSRDPRPVLDYGGVRKALEEKGVSTYPEISGHPRPDKREGPAAEGCGRGRSEAEAICEAIPSAVKPLVIEIPEQLYRKVAYRESTEGIIAEVEYKSLSLEDLQLPDNPLIVVLESVEKPGNLGAVLRSADAAGAHAVLVCDPLTDLYNPNLIRASIGAIFTVPTVAVSSAQAIPWLKDHGIKILTAQLQDSSLYYDTPMQGGVALVMGTESTGLTQPWREAADAHIRIPMLGRLDSLNVSVSTAILLFEAVRQRQA